MAMDKITFRRILKWGFLNFFRNGVVSAATVLVISLSIFMIGSVIVGSAFLSGIISSLEEKVDISAYFKTGAPEEQILALKKDLEALPEVRAVKYISADEALAAFRERHIGDEAILQSLEVVGANPFSSSLEIKAHDSSKYDAISKFLEKGSYGGILDADSSGQKKITYRQNQFVIDRLSSLLSTSRRIGFAVSLILAVIALMVAYSTVRLAIYNSRDEISVMQLVGASRAFIRGPFLVEGIIHGIIASFFTLALLYPAFWLMGNKTSALFGGVNVFQYFLSNILQIFFILLVAGVLLGVLSAYIAIRRYLKV
ncbi:hypothetical protein A3B05_02580 [Candidatus Giovannonibacteria bacterium RIFCSPLOWO2_01_FULL_43_160]|uniref:Cell division protein FtsX n=2 Tax=Candidatus Giovannoniibacteriota TaxID=1752738 RepID=A0A0G1IU94_9BACT|nr:MAG: hypothetical protein UV72_C0006G0005 [Candidatus Giovannonibacteria bacterium GW2011_GWB1_43_13]KKS99389.1 MAG: hypothetical protein UV75_C0005G0006 [Candidatus Giovannonibacteria bacterium GW2011_GWA1_43_15]KKT21767.1 MAG: hypothetical protein UW05_C0003G0003 [Candidatus Giovannonibacteria bacterium GW2011_GWC2_43_8]KKT62926.1 MAG: hypothetical protein UW55_C0008G0007 [Candidatus Giovannonibacteria bacterium GW2011_GWA2_44_26]OGF58734.1 MAG: hypothetical protein A2652_00600 [Candidatus